MICGIVKDATSDGSKPYPPAEKAEAGRHSNHTRSLTLNPSLSSGSSVDPPPASSPESPAVS